MGKGGEMRSILNKTVLCSLLAVASNVLHAQFNTGEEYNLVNYAGEASRNPVAELNSQLRSGEKTLNYSGERGFLDSLLTALDIDPSSQLFVFSPTSLQHKLISPARPRALYFNDETYIGYVQNSEIIEVTTLDEEKGIVFYTFDNAPRESRHFERAMQSCLVCHDTQGTMGGGIPMLMALSSVYSKRNTPLANYSGIGNITDESPIEDRWGGWYVTGRHGLQSHLGNILLEDSSQLENLDDYRIWNLETLDGTGYMDASHYPRDTSDIVALMVLEHQLTVQNQVSYVRHKAPAVLMRRGLEEDLDANSWDELSSEAQKALTSMLTQLVKSLIFEDAAVINSRLSGSKEFVANFEKRGPMDEKGRSLRELQADETLFKYPVSYLVYSDDLNSLPIYAKEFVYSKLDAYLRGNNVGAGNPLFQESERTAALEILLESSPEFHKYVMRHNLGKNTLTTWN